MKNVIQHKKCLDVDEQSISIIPFDLGTGSDENRRVFLELQLTMATSSINHEYARKEFDETGDAERKDELLEYMHDCRAQYFEARQGLASYDPYALVEFERDLMRQKQAILAHYSA
jgi:hypothetical protein